MGSAGRPPHRRKLTPCSSCFSRVSGAGHTPRTRRYLVPGGKLLTFWPRGAHEEKPRLDGAQVRLAVSKTLMTDSGEGGSVLDPKLLIDMVQMDLNSTFAKAQPARNVLVRQAFRCQVHNFAFALR